MSTRFSLFFHHIWLDLLQVGYTSCTHASLASLSSRRFQCLLSLRPCSWACACLTKMSYCSQTFSMEFKSRLSAGLFHQLIPFFWKNVVTRVLRAIVLVKSMSMRIGSLNEGDQWGGKGYHHTSWYSWCYEKSQDVRHHSQRFQSIHESLEDVCVYTLVCGQSSSSRRIFFCCFQLNCLFICDDHILEFLLVIQAFLMPCKSLFLVGFTNGLAVPWSSVCPP